MKRTAKLILALDVDNRADACKLAKALYPEVRIFKVGLQLYTAYGPEIIADIRGIGADVFLDLKFNDIPNTMAAAAKEAVKHKAAMITVHTLSGPTALKEVARSCGNSGTKVLGVTILTSICPHFLQDLKIKRSLSDEVLYLARLAKRSGLDGVVCSAREADLIRKNIRGKFIIVTPGIRSDDAPGDDQHRTATVTEAVRWGSDYLVVGRPILRVPDPLQAAREFNRFIKEAGAGEKR